jgi:hypothetical protein
VRGPVRRPGSLHSPIVGAALLAAALLGAACHAAAEPAATETRAATDVSDFRLTIVQSGGIAGTLTTASVDGSTMTYTLKNGFCAPGAPCPAGDSESGALDEREVRALRSLVAAEWDALLDDYGRSEGAADLFEYELDIRLAGRTKRVTADDLTMPTELRTIRDALFQAIDSARSR